MRAFFSCVRGPKIFLNSFWKHYNVRAKKLHNNFFKFIFNFFGIKLFFFKLRTFSNVNVIKVSYCRTGYLDWACNNALMFFLQIYSHKGPFTIYWMVDSKISAPYYFGDLGSFSSNLIFAYFTWTSFTSCRGILTSSQRVSTYFSKFSCIFLNPNIFFQFEL